MNYYIQGDAANAEEIKATFEKLGVASNADRYNYKNDNMLYFTAGGMIHMIDANGSWANIIKTHPDYKELELPAKPKFKVGDWLWHKTKGVFQMMVEDYDEKEGYLMQFTDETKCYFGRDIIENDYRLWNFRDSKVGDILYDKAYNRIGIFENFGHHPDGGSFNDKTYCYLIIYYDIDDKELYEEVHNDMDGSDAVPATKEQRDLLFAKMQESGYQWDAEKKELRRINLHYDIANFYAGMPVLVRDDRGKKWSYALYSHYDSEADYPFVTAGDNVFIQCIPFEGNEYLLGTTDMPSEKFINW